MTHLGDLLSTYLDGELSAAEQSQVALHLAGCETCRIELDDVSTARAWVRSLPTLELPVIDVSVISPPVRRVRRRVALVGVAAAFAAFVAVGAMMEPEPQQISAPEFVQAHLARSASLPAVNSGGLASITNAAVEPAP